MNMLQGMAERKQTASSEIIFRNATLEDRDALVALGRASFDAAFGHLYTQENLARFLHSAHSPEKVAAQLVGGHVAYRLAFRGRRLAGYCKLVEGAQFGDHSHAKRPIALSQLYTDPASTGQGIGAGLMDWALAEAKHRRKDAIQLSVWSENVGAQRFYARYGFAKIADIDFWVGEHRDDEFLYELKL
ncbi:GNAT family N-acetyltransferase [Croceicoccus bisphenolivorans]|uniref:GNAT family N-acetyltransferase n=1 Tax=Croceicoccus bisphenolivorans TaxID=1783232 RepID=UPI000B05233B|nr:N-acetyltransferase [Croceicoccus bisphenolivorans]